MSFTQAEDVNRGLATPLWRNRKCAADRLADFIAKGNGALTIPSYERGVARLLRYDRHP